jgi:hypothetical protein
MKGYLKRLLALPFATRRMDLKIDDLLVLQAKSLIKTFDYTKELPSLHEAEFKVFSQWGDDGIIQYLINKLPIHSKKFIEFGVENYRESNTRFLLINNNWSGLIFDGSAKHINTIQSDDVYWRYNLIAENAFITKHNINQLLHKNGFNNKVGILHIDIDGNDYWIWETIENVDADIVIMEFNPYFGTERAISVPYNDNFIISNAHFSWLYYGASLPAFVHLAVQKGFFFIGCNSAGNNAYFVNNRHKGTIKEMSVAEGFVAPQSRPARNQEGQLTFLSYQDSINLIKGTPVINVFNGKAESF